jgi:hypothetical protein
MKPLRNMGGDEESMVESDEKRKGPWKLVWESLRLDSQ